MARTLTLNGETRTVQEWADRLGFSAQMIRERLNRGWSDERVLTTPKLKSGDNSPWRPTNHSMLNRLRRAKVG